jgi:hypothetical protein
VREATLTHHLNAMDARGLVTRTRDAANWRVQVVALTEAGEATFVRLRDTAIAFDARLRAALADDDLATLSTVLGHLTANVGTGEAAPPRVGLADRRPEYPARRCRFLPLRNGLPAFPGRQIGAISCCALKLGRRVIAS